MDLSLRVPDFHTFHTEIESDGTNPCMLKAGESVFGQELVMTSRRQWNDVEFASWLPELSNQLEMSVK